MNNYTCFDVLSPEAKYWCGFIAGDGCVTTHSISFNLSEIDIDHLEKFRKFVGTDREVKRVQVVHPEIWGDGKMARISVPSKYLSDRMISLGLVPRKCKVDFSVVPELAFSKDFWRGMIDADGSVHLGLNHGVQFPVIAVSANGFAIISQFSQYIKSISGYEFQPRKYKVAWTIAFNGNKARDIINHLYYDRCECLERKRITADQCKSWVGIREANRNNRYMSIRALSKGLLPYKYSLKLFQDPTSPPFLGFPPPY